MAGKLHPSRKASSFTESVIREMTRLSDLHGAINLGQGFPDFPAPAAVKDAAVRAITEDHNQYPVTWGVPAFRRAIAEKYDRDYGMRFDPDAEICVTCGSTEAMIASFLGLLDTGDEVVTFEPYYENAAPDSILAGAELRYVALRPPAWSFDTGRARRSVLRSHAGDRDHVAPQPDRQGLLGRRARGDRPALPGARRDRDHRRDLRAHHLRRSRAHPDRDAPGDA